MRSRAIPRSPVGLPFILLTTLLVVLWVAGGASRADALGQIFVRATAWGLLIVGLIFGARASFGHVRPLVIILAAAVLLVTVQLVPLPPAVWQLMPGRAPLSAAATISDQAQVWRPWSIVPGATLNALFSLIVPIAALIFVAGISDDEHRWLLALVLGLISASTLLGLLQISGATFRNPLINDTLGEVSGTFANRNHFALLMAFGCMVAPVWAFHEGRRPQWRAPVALGLVLLFALTILATGSRAGIVTGVLAIGLALLMTYKGIRKALNRYPRWVLPAAVAGIVGIIAAFALISIMSDKAASISRALAEDPRQDIRSQNLPTVIAMIIEYFPFGSGFGGFDPVFRMHEKFSQLNLKYFNHAHNDFLEIVLDSGFLGLLAMLGALAWWARASIRAWRTGSTRTHSLARLGSAMLLLIFVASLFDYPARTPMIMAMAVIAGTWLSNVGRTGPALPEDAQHL